MFRHMHVVLNGVYLQNMHVVLNGVYLQNFFIDGLYESNEPT